MPSPPVREAAERTLSSLVDRVADGRAHCLWIEGEAGAGKSALIDHLSRRAAGTGCLVLKASCPFPGEGDLPWSRMLAGSDPPLPFDLLARALDPDSLSDLAEIAPAFAASSPARPAPPGLPETDRAQRRWRSLARLLDLLTRRAPLALVIDDIHRASADLGNQIGFLFRTLAQNPLLWIIAGEQIESDGALLGLRQTLEGLRRVTALPLGPLQPEELGAMLGERFDPDDLERLVPWLIRKTGGNPLYVREVVRSLIESGKIIRPAGEDRYALIGGLDAIPIPPSFEGLVRERLLKMSGDDLLVLRAVAALGGEASPGNLRRLLRRPTKEIDSAIRSLLGKGLLHQPLPGTKRFQMQPDWLDRVALDSASDPPAEELCIRAAEVLPEDRELAEPIRLSRRARALERAGPQHWAAAAAAHRQAAAVAWEVHSQGAARAHIESALELLDTCAPAVRTAEQEKTYRALEEMVLELAGRIHAMIGPFPRGVEELERLLSCLELRRPAPRPTRWVEIELLLGEAHRNLGDYDSALACYERALGRLRRKEGSRRMRALTLHEIGWAHYERGDHDAGLRAARQATIALKRVGQALDICRAMNLEGLILWAQSRYPEAARIFQETLRRLEPLGTVPLVAGVWNNLGLVHWSLGDLQQASRCLTRARRIRMEMGQLRGEAICLANLALVEEDRGNFEASARLHRQALRLRESLGDRRGVVIGLGNLANILRQTGEWEEGGQLAEQALAECRTLGVSSLEPGILCTCSGLHRLLGRPAEALQEARECVASARRFHNQRLVAYGLETAARAAADLGEVAEARRMMSEARETIASASPIDLATILLSDAAMLLHLAEQDDPKRRPKSIDEARRNAGEAVALFEKHDARARVTRAGELLRRLGLSPPGLDAHAGRGPEPPGPRGEVRILCFGPLRIVTPLGKEIGPADWGSHKARAIFAYLLFHRLSDPGIPRERILEAIWPEAPLDTVENTFHATLALLRKALAAASEPNPPWASVTHAGGCYLLSFVSDPWVDCTEFERGLADGARWERQGNYFRAAAVYREVESLYSSDFLEDSYQGWTDRLRDRYRQDYLDLLLRLGILAVEMWNPAEAVGWVGKLRDHDPLDERACRLGMQAQVAVGHRKAAIDLYRTLVRQLQEDLGVDPEPLTTECYRRLKAGEPLSAVALPEMLAPTRPGPRL